MTTLDLCIVADRFGPTSRTYLAYLGAAGYRVRRILLVDFIKPSPVFRRRQERWGSWVASFSKQRFKLPAAPWTFEKQEIADLLQKRLRVPVDYSGEFDFAAHAEDFEEFTAEDFEDHDLWSRLFREKSGALLYTDGGRVPRAFLSRCEARMLHVHPGIVPEVRGSDCLFWSMLMRGRPGASCFYMNEGIDTGDIIATKEFPAPDYPELLPYIARDPALVRRAILDAYDPHLRAELFLDVAGLADNGDLRSLAVTRQSPGEGRNYYWMHPRLYPTALRRFAGRDSAA